MQTVQQILSSMEYGPAPESSEHVDNWLSSHAAGFGHFINGEFVTSSKKPSRLDVFNPASGEKIAKIAQGTTADVNRAVDAADAALSSWSALSARLPVDLV